MKFIFLIFIGMLIGWSNTSHAQTKRLNCDTLDAFVHIELERENYKKAATYLFQKEQYCDSMNRDDWDRLIGSLENVIYEESEEGIKVLYVDSLIEAYEKQEEAGFYDKKSDLRRAGYYMMLAIEDPLKTDFYFQRGIKNHQGNISEAYLIMAAYTTFLLYHQANEETKDTYKKRIFSDHFRYLDLLDSTTNKATPQTIEVLNSYVKAAFPSCEEIFPEVQSFIESPTTDTTLTIHRIKQMEELLREMTCRDSRAYIYLMNKWLEFEPNNIEAHSNRWWEKPINALERIDQLLDTITDREVRAELVYQKSVLQLKSGQYHAAYTTGLSCTGKYKNDGIYIAAKSVAVLANSCGESTFERKCNFIYAAQLAEEAGQPSAAALYRASGPKQGSCDESDQKPVQLNCWGVVVNVCEHL